MMVRMKTIMKLEDLKTISQLTDFLSGTQAVAFSIILDKDARYRWVQGVLHKFRYRKRGKQDKGVLIRYLMKISGYSRQQITRLIAQYRKTGIDLCEPSVQPEKVHPLYPATASLRENPIQTFQHR